MKQTMTMDDSALEKLQCLSAGGADKFSYVLLINYTVFTSIHGNSNSRMRSIRDIIYKLSTAVQ